LNQLVLRWTKHETVGL